MLYLSGAIRPEISHPSLGWMFSPRMGNRVPDHGYYAIDNGCFGNPEGFAMGDYAAFVAKKIAQGGRERCLFVVAPDVPFDADGTIRRFEQYSADMRALGLPVAFVTQDGMGVEDVPWGGTDALFVGGSDGWKTGHESGALINAAKRRGVWVHVGRVNTTRRWDAALSLGADSVDGTKIAYGVDENWPWVRDRLENPQLGMVIA